MEIYDEDKNLLNLHHSEVNTRINWQLSWLLCESQSRRDYSAKKEI
jgi:hypothetical protein